MTSKNRFSLSKILYDLVLTSYREYDIKVTIFMKPFVLEGINVLEKYMVLLSKN